MGIFNFMKQKSVQDLFDEALFDAAVGYYEKAVKIYQKAAEQGALEAPEAWFRCGLMYDKLRKQEKALEAYRSATEKGHELAAMAVGCREQFLVALLRALTPDELPRLRPLPDDPGEFIFVDELQNLSEEQTRELASWRARAEQIEELKKRVRMEEKEFDKRYKEEKLPGQCSSGATGIFLGKDRLLETAAQWIDIEMALLGDGGAQKRTAEHILKIMGGDSGDREAAAVTYWRMRSIQQGDRKALYDMQSVYHRKYDLNGYRYWEKVQKTLDASKAGICCTSLESSEISTLFPLWEKAYEKAECMRKRAIEEYPEEAPTEFCFQRETQDIDKAKIRKLFDSARHAYKNGKTKDVKLAYQQAAFLGDAEAQFRYGRMLLPNYSLETFRHEYTTWASNKRGNPSLPPLRSMWDAVYWLAKSARQGNYKACWEMFHLYSDSILSLSLDVSDMLYWMILAVRAEFERPLGQVNDEDEFFRPYSSGGLGLRYCAVREAVKKQGMTGQPDFAKWNIDPVGEALYRIGLLYELDSRYDLAVPMHRQAAALHNEMAQVHLNNLKKTEWYGRAADTVAMPIIGKVTPNEELLLAYAQNGDLDAAMCLAGHTRGAWYEVVKEAVSVAAPEDPVCNYLYDEIGSHKLGERYIAQTHIFFNARSVLSGSSEEVIEAFRKGEFGLFVNGMNMKLFCERERNARRYIAEQEREFEEELAMEELEEQLEEQKEKLAAYNKEMKSYMDELVVRRKAEDYGEYGFYAKQSVIDQINEKRRKLEDEYGL